MVMVRKREQEKRQTEGIGMLVRSRRTRKKRLFLLLCDLGGSRDVSRPINEKEKSMCYTLCKFSITCDWEGQMKKTKQ
jgi:hypothetical protein